MIDKHSYADHVVAHEKSVVLGGAKVLFPVDPSLTNGFARQIQMLVKDAEEAAYRRGYEGAQCNMRVMLGITQ
jgi:hypothetical protein